MLLTKLFFLLVITIATLFFLIYMLIWCFKSLKELRDFCNEVQK